MAVARIWQAPRTGRWRVGAVKLSPAPTANSHLREMVGLYVNPRAVSAVSSHDEKAQLQVLGTSCPDGASAGRDDEPRPPQGPHLGPIHRA